MTNPAPDVFDYQAEADRLILVGRALDDLDLVALRQAVTHAHTLGPIVDPTRYRDAVQRGDLDRIAKLAHAAAEFQAAWRDVRDELEGGDG